MSSNLIHLSFTKLFYEYYDVYKTKSPWQHNTILSRANILSAVPPWFPNVWIRALSEIPSYLRQLTHALRHRILSLTTFHYALSGPFNILRSICSQLIRLSVCALIFLSPLQRFIFLIYFNITLLFFIVNIFT